MVAIENPIDIGSALLRQQLLNAQQLDQLQLMAKQQDLPLWEVAVQQKAASEHDIWQLLSDLLASPLMDLQAVTIDSSVAATVPAVIAFRHQIVPISIEAGLLTLAASSPYALVRTDELRVTLGREITVRLALPSQVQQVIKTTYGIGADTVSTMLDQDQSPAHLIESNTLDLAENIDRDQEATIIRFVNQLILEGVQLGASDIHVEPEASSLRVRYRLDGMLQDATVPPNIKQLESAIVSRIKVMAEMDIAETRLPQDGQIRIMVVERPVDIRISTIPVTRGESVVMRLLDHQALFRELDELGLPRNYLSLMEAILGLPHGMMLVTGPTGSGKTTTLYAALHKLNHPDRKIITVEDPVEYQLERVDQVLVKDAIGLGFSTLLRSILRHDPDILMIGEIRDRETANIAISAAMTGHQVFSTLHTNNASGAPVRLMDMEVAPYLVASSLEAVIAQRLVRVICPHCKEACKQPPDELLAEFEDLSNLTFYRGEGCPRCRRMGYQGRTAIFELFTVDDQMRDLIQSRPSAASINQLALSQGMCGLRESGLELVRNGITSLEEIYRVTRDNTIEMQSLMKDRS